MSLVADIAKSYWAPGVVVATRLRVVSEPQALATLMGACLLIFVGQWPLIARAAFLDPEIEFQARLGGAMLAWIFIMPLVIYVVTAVIWAATRTLRIDISGLAVRFVVFWGLLAATPIWLLHCLFRGFSGNNWVTDIVGISVLAALVWVWFGGFRAALRLSGGLDE